MNNRISSVRCEEVMHLPSSQGELAFAHAERAVVDSHFWEHVDKGAVVERRSIAAPMNTEVAFLSITGVLRQRLRVLELERQVAQLSERVNSLVASQSVQSPGQQSPNSNPAFSKVVQMTKELYAGDVKIEVDFDPAEPDCTHVVFNVSDSGTAQEIVERRRDWHRRLRQIEPGNSGPLRLSVTVSAS
ncbi:hypothetical protein ACFL2H_08595 [Planctomycetota bacterium]